MTEYTRDGWIKYFADDTEEDGWDHLVRAKEASWSKGRLHGMCRVDLYTGAKIYTLRSGGGDTHVEPTDEELKASGMTRRWTGHSHSTSNDTLIKSRKAYKVSGDYEYEKPSSADRVGVFWQVDDYIAKFSPDGSGEGDMVGRRLFRLVEPADIGRCILWRNQSDRLDIYLGHRDLVAEDFQSSETGRIAIQKSWLSKWITLEVDLVTDTWKIRVVDKEG